MKTLYDGSMLRRPKIWWLYWRLRLAICRRMDNVLAQVRNAPLISIGPHCSVHRTVRLSPFLDQDSRLLLRLQGHNRVGAGTLIQGSGTIDFGEHSYCGVYCVFGVNQSVRIGRNVMIADGVTIRDTSHNFGQRETPMIAQGFSTSSVEIQDDVWIGYGATITMGVTIAHGAIVGAGAVVTKDVLEYEIVAGVPARAIGWRPL